MKPDLSVTIVEAVNLKAATQAMISTLKAQRPLFTYLSGDPEVLY
jgi:hypothetical protein